jgi:hypothetical protein
MLHYHEDAMYDALSRTDTESGSLSHLLPADANTGTPETSDMLIGFTVATGSDKATAMNPKHSSNDINSIELDDQPHAPHPGPSYDFGSDPSFHPGHFQPFNEVHTGSDKPTPMEPADSSSDDINSDESDNTPHAPYPGPSHDFGSDPSFHPGHFQPFEDKPGYIGRQEPPMHHFHFFDLPEGGSYQPMQPEQDLPGEQYPNNAQQEPSDSDESDQDTPDNTDSDLDSFYGALHSAYHSNADCDDQETEEDAEQSATPNSHHLGQVEDPESLTASLRQSDSPDNLSLGELAAAGEPSGISWRSLHHSHVNCHKTRVTHHHHDKDTSAPGAGTYRGVSPDNTHDTNAGWPQDDSSNDSNISHSYEEHSSDSDATAFPGDGGDGSSRGSDSSSAMGFGSHGEDGSSDTKESIAVTFLSDSWGSSSHANNNDEAPASSDAEGSSNASSSGTVAFAGAGQAQPMERVGSQQQQQQLQVQQHVDKTPSQSGITAVGPSTKPLPALASTADSASQPLALEAPLPGQLPSQQPDAANKQAQQPAANHRAEPLAGSTDGAPTPASAAESASQHWPQQPPEAPFSVPQPGQLPGQQPDAAAEQVQQPNNIWAPESGTTGSLPLPPVATGNTAAVSRQASSLVGSDLVASAPAGGGSMADGADQGPVAAAIMAQPQHLQHSLDAELADSTELAVGRAPGAAAVAVAAPAPTAAVVVTESL